MEEDNEEIVSELISDSSSDKRKSRTSSSSSSSNSSSSESSSLDGDPKVQHFDKNQGTKKLQAKIITVEKLEANSPENKNKQNSMPLSSQTSFL